MSAFLFTVGILSSLNLGRSCGCCRSLCESLCVSVLLCLEDAVSLDLFTAFDSSDLSISFSVSISESRRQGLDEDIPFRAERSEVPRFLHVVLVWVSVLAPVDCKNFL